MKVAKFISKIEPGVQIKITADDKTIVSINSKYWDCIESAILNLKIKDIKCVVPDPKQPARIIIETETGKPIYARTQADLEMLFDDPNVMDIALAADIRASSDYGYLIYMDGGIKRLDLNGHRLYSGSATADSDGVISAIRLTNNATLGIYDTEGGGVVDAGNSGDYNAAILANDESRVDIYGGEYFAGDTDGKDSSVLDSRDSLIAVHGGYFENTGDGEYSSIFHHESSGAFECSGGVYKGLAPADYIKDGYEMWMMPKSEAEDIYYRILKAI